MINSWVMKSNGSCKVGRSKTKSVLVTYAAIHISFPNLQREREREGEGEGERLPDMQTKALSRNAESCEYVS